MFRILWTEQLCLPVPCASTLPHAAFKAPDQVFRLRQDFKHQEARTRLKGSALFVHQRVISPEDNHCNIAFFYNKQYINVYYGKTTNYVFRFFCVHIFTHFVFM